MTLPDVSAGDQAVQRNFREHERRLDALTNRAELSGARDDPEQALANLIEILVAKLIISDSTTPS